MVFCAYDFVKKVGGPNVWLLRLLPALIKRGVNVSVLFFSQDPSNSPTAEALSNDGVKVSVSHHLRFTEQKIQWLFERLEEDPPDIFVPNLMVPAYYASGWLRDRGIPTVGVLHSDDSFHRGLQDEFVFGEEFFRLSGLVCVSNYLCNEVSAKSPRSTILRTIPCGAPTSAIVANRSKDNLKLVYVGRLVEEQKRISDVAKALCRVVAEVPGVEATIYGIGPAETSIKKIWAEYGQGLPLHLAGMMPSKEIQTHLLKHDVFVLLSDYEGLPIALMEAMGCGLVPVCTDMRSGIPELVRHGFSGLIVKDRGDDFISAIITLKENLSLWEELSHNAKKIIDVGYDVEICADKWHQLLKELYKKSNRQKIEFPKSIQLPKTNKYLTREDKRRVSLPIYYVSQAIKIINKRLM